MEYNKRFPVLSTIAMVLWIAGLVIAIIGAFKLGSDIVEAAKMHAEQDTEWAFGEVLEIVVSFGTLLYGLATMAAAEIIGVLFAIEKNTRERAEA